MVPALAAVAHGDYLLCARWVVPQWHGLAKSLVVGLASWAWPKEPLQLWAAVRPVQIVEFFHFSIGLIEISFKSSSNF
jgi:hypothetical protein